MTWPSLLSAGSMVETSTCSEQVTSAKKGATQHDIDPSSIGLVAQAYVQTVEEEIRSSRGFGPCRQSCLAEDGSHEKGAV